MTCDGHVAVFSFSVSTTSQCRRCAYAADILSRQRVASVGLKEPKAHETQPLCHGGLVSQTYLGYQQIPELGVMLFNLGFHNYGLTTLHYLFLLK